MRRPRIEINELAGEEWRAVPEYPGYEASNLGRIKSPTRLVDKTGLAGPYKYLRAGRIMRTFLSYGRHRVCLCVSGKKKNEQVHVMVLLAFVGPRPLGYDGCHNDGNPENNRLDNLRWDTRKANQADRWAHGTAYYGERHYLARLTDEQVREIFLDARMHKEIAPEYGIHLGTVAMIKYRKTRRTATEGLVRGKR